MLRGSVLLLTWSFFALSLFHAHAAGHELPRPLRLKGDWLPSGYSQSPIEFNMCEMFYKPYDPEVNGLKTAYHSATSHLSIEHENTLQVSFDEPAGALYQRGMRFDLKQFHFHSPPEHTFKQYPHFCDSHSFTTKQADLDKESSTVDGENMFVMEMHLVHETSANNIAVIGVLFTLGEPNQFLDKFWSYITNLEEGETSVGPIDVDDLNLSDTFIRYSGSLTTYPYTEGVRWTVMCGQWNTISHEQLELYKQKFPDANNREIQPVNGRKVVANFPLYDTVRSGLDIEKKGPTLVQSA